MDNGNGKNEVKDQVKKKTIKTIWKIIPLNIKLMILASGVGVFTIVLFVLVLTTLNPVNHISFSDKTSTDGYNMDQAYNEFIMDPCVEGNTNCSDRQKHNYSVLKDDEQRFIKKLNKVAARYSLTNEQKYILLTTVYYGFDENYFYNKKDGASEFKLDSGAYVLDNDDDAVGDDNSILQNVAEYFAVDTLKELGKQFEVYPALCKFTTTNENGEKVENVEPLNDGDGSQFGFGFWEHIKKSTTDEGFDEAQAECEKKENGEVVSGEKTTNSEASDIKFYKYLEENPYLDIKPALQKTFFKPYYQTHHLKKWEEKDLIAVRREIIEDIKKIVELKIEYDKRFGLNDKCGTTGTAGAGTDYWWPLADNESGGFGVGESSHTKISSNFGPRKRPCAVCSANHGGIDIGAPSGVPIIASKGGTVTIAKPSESAGNYVAILDASGNVLKYMHMTRYIVKAGDVVQQGQVIGYVGSTGHSTGPHLHFQFELGGTTKVDPLLYVDPNNQRPGGTINNNLDGGNSLNATNIQATTVSNNNPTYNIISQNLINTDYALNKNKIMYLADENTNPSSSQSELTGNTIDVNQLKKETTQEKNFDPVSNDIINAYNGTTDIWTNVSDAILTAAGVDRQGNRIPGGIQYHEYRQCQTYVGLVYQKAGLGYVSHGTAYGAAKDELVSKSMSVIPVGAAVWGTSSTYAGHAGIYIGNGLVIHNTGSKLPQPITPLKEWALKYHYVGWGWTSGADKVTSATASAPISNSSLSSSISDTQCITTNGDGSVLVGNDTQQTLCLTFKNNNYSDNAIAGILGNVERESNFNPEAKNYLGCIGLFQFCPSGEKSGYLNKYGDAWSDPNNQIEWVVHQLEVAPIDKKAREFMLANPTADVATMTEIFCRYYERPGNKICVAHRNGGQKYLSYVQNNCGGANPQTVSRRGVNTQNISKKIFVGDSRTVGMCAAMGAGNVKTCDLDKSGSIITKGNDVYSAGTGRGLAWMKNTGIPAIEGQITQGTAIILLFGVNDLKTPGQSGKYADYVNAKVNNWVAKGASVYFVSVNPVVDGKSSVKNADIIKFNNELKSKLNNNIGYIDTYSRLQSNFSSPDGIHYNPATYKNIYNIISDSLSSSTPVSNQSTPISSANTVVNTTGHKIENRNGITYIDNVMVVNKSYSLPSSYVPSNTHKPVNGQTKCVDCIVEEAYTAYTKLREAGLAAGVPKNQLEIVSGYRSYNYQDGLWTSRKNRRGAASADRSTARAGFSEHQTGYAMDICETNESYANKKGGKFLATNAYKYGFIIRYPKGKEASTGFIYEPWHLRYVGVDLATKLYNGGNWITLEEYFGISSQYTGG